MIKMLVTILGLLAAPLVTTSAFAFQEVPEAPPAQAGDGSRSPQPPTTELQTPTNGAEPGGEKSSGIFNFGILPKLDIGLELLYGERHQQVEQNPTFDAPEDFTLFGKVKKRF